MKRFTKTIRGRKTLTILVKHSILDIWQDSEYASKLIRIKVEDHSSSELPPQHSLGKIQEQVSVTFCKFKITVSVVIFVSRIRIFANC